MATLDAERINERAEIVWDSDATCESCGADPKRDDGAAIQDEAWFMDLIQTPDAVVAQVICPSCLQGVTS